MKYEELRQLQPQRKTSQRLAFRQIILPADLCQATCCIGLNACGLLALGTRAAVTDTHATLVQ